MYSVTEAFVTWLSSKGYAASTYPPKSGTEFVTVERTGGGVEEFTDQPTIAIQCWAATEPRAEEMANAIRAELLSDYPVGVVKVEVNAGPYPYWDEATRLSRYQLVLDCAAQLLADNE